MSILDNLEKVCLENKYGEDIENFKITFIRLVKLIQMYLDSDNKGLCLDCKGGDVKLSHLLGVGDFILIDFEKSNNSDVSYMILNDDLKISFRYMRTLDQLWFFNVEECKGSALQKVTQCLRDKIKELESLK